MDAVLHQLTEKMAFHVGLHDTAGKVDGQRIVKADDGAVGAGGKGLAHVNVKPVDVRLHVLGILHGSHIGQAGRGDVYKRQLLYLQLVFH